MQTQSQSPANGHTFCGEVEVEANGEVLSVTKCICDHGIEIELCIATMRIDVPGLA